jgi:acyl carrier protein
MLSEERLKQVVAAVLDCAPGDLDDAVSRDTFANWDSLRHMNLIMALEEEFGVVIGDDDADAMTSYAEIRRIVASSAG